MQEQVREQRLFLAAMERHLAPPVEHLEWAQDAEIHPVLLELTVTPQSSEA